MNSNTKRYCYLLIIKHTLLINKLFLALFTLPRIYLYFRFDSDDNDNSNIFDFINNLLEFESENLKKKQYIVVTIINIL